MKMYWHHDEEEEGGMGRMCWQKDDVQMIHHEHDDEE